jgi:hypothetical protein
MTLILPPLPSFQTEIPAMPSPVDTYAKILQMKAMSGQIAMQPLQQQQAEQAIQAGKQDMQQRALQIQMQQMQVASMQARAKAWADPDFVNSFMGGSNSSVESSLGFAPGFDPVRMIKGEVSRGVNPDDAMKEAASFLELSKNLSMKTKDDLANYKASHEEASKILAPVMDMQVSEAGPAFEAAKQKIAAIPGLDPADRQFVLQATLDHAGALVQRLGIAGQLADFHKQKAEAVAATPEGKAAIAGAEAQAKLNVESSPQALRLAANKAASEANARQAAAQGDPNVAGQMLARGDFTLADLKSRGTTPQFITKAVAAAQKVNPTYNPADEVIAESVAKSQSANQFFGSANSLIGKGGTLDQLEKLGRNIPQNSIPVLNTFDDWQKLARGKGPLAGYAATALGVADDYGKVMGGGNASDHARDAALALFGQAASPEQRAAAIQSTRDTVQSQRDARIGNNQFLKRQYGVEVSKGVAAQPIPGGATGKARGSDGNWYYHDAKGNILGQAQ